ncbi:MAG: AbrB/MazE/SpoVT family DNA-binding domain-containing protein [Candidatus Nitrosotenuis sp.]|uniref:Transcriptional regulator, AbrB family n=1 Tax=Candidatus Nitrosotenuis uzonensis TaxID=1407055 RepID=V6AT70_9ARCH|nr:AbrB/MazE/SpoVT family DNA-binding domain-containing protein [Candidatus Nitrosotenuis uzonensis]MCA2003533.1 AbrB/MazE/SpoVT family DNA-binding domain-containing protein [Candidatus Nitrosotenuis sp.]CAE6498092.1 Transcriptional regulator, AbrB family [Candidatus Nitrosotenuis uzonensis]CDI05779.1 Transcriptional regulator, AbrB family [Candidatus Nitrosotenuis uzonensis]
MVANNDQSNYVNMFQEWMQKGGKAQSEFIKAFCSYMEGNQKFDPLQSLKEMTSKAAEMQANIANNVSSLQKNTMEQMFNLGNMMQNFMGWGAFKTTVGSNGRISIPEAERDALKLSEGDLVQVLVLPLEKRKSRSS